MIYAKKHRVKFKGKGADLVAEMTVLLRNMRRLLVSNGLPAEVADEFIDKCVRASRMTDEELDEEIARMEKKRAEKEEAEG